MLHIEKISNNYKVTIQGGVKTVHEWGKDEEINYCFSSDIESYNKSFDIDINHLEDIGKKVIDSINSSNSSNMKESDFIIMDNCLSWSQIEDADCNILESSEEVEEETYICNYDVSIFVNGIELKEEDLRELFHKAQ